MLTCEDSGTRSRYPRHEQAIASHRIPWDAITFPHLRHPPPQSLPPPAKVLTYAEHSRYIAVSSCHRYKERRSIVWGLVYEVTNLSKILVSFLSSYVIKNTSYPTAIYRKSLVQLIWLQYLSWINLKSPKPLACKISGKSTRYPSQGWSNVYFIEWFIMILHKNSWIIHHLVMIICISYEIKFTISLPKLINSAPL